MEILPKNDTLHIILICPRMEEKTLSYTKKTVLLYKRLIERGKKCFPWSEFFYDNVAFRVLEYATTDYDTQILRHLVWVWKVLPQPSSSIDWG